MDKNESRKVAYVRDWLTAFTKYRFKNEGQFPGSFNEASPFWETDSDLAADFNPSQFKLVYRGSWKALRKPNEIILIAERNALQGPDGTWSKVYGMADGSVVQQRGDLAFFEAWERETRGNN